MKDTLKQVFYISLAVALGMGTINCTGHSKVYDSEEEDMIKKERKAKENKKKAEQMQKDIKEKEAQKQQIKIDNENLKGEELKAWKKLQTGMDRSKHCYGRDYFEGNVVPKCNRCGSTFGYLTPAGFEQLRDEFGTAGGAGKNWLVGTNEPWRYNCAYFQNCPYCVTNDSTYAIQAKVNANTSTIAKVENVIKEGKSAVQQAEAAYTECSNRAAQIKKRIDRNKKETEGRLKAEARVAEMEKQVAEKAEKDKKDKVDKVKMMLGLKLSLNDIISISALSREEIKKIAMDMGMNIDKEGKPV